MALSGLFGGGAGLGRDAAGAAGAATVAAGADAAAVAADAAVPSGFSLSHWLHTMRKFGGFFNYLTSRWSLACFAVALILNRVTIYGSTRRHLSLRWHVRLALRIVPIVLFVGQIIALLQAIRCQTSPKYPQIRYGKPGKLSNFDYGGQDGFLHSFSSFLLNWQDDEGSCDAVHMKRLSGTNDVPYGSFSLLWPVFLRLCLNQFVETLSCALQGRGVATEAGMSIFEHSLAFAEAETMISQSIGLGLFGASKSTGQASSSNSTSFLSTTPLLSRSQVLDRFNVFPELLLIALISCCNCLSSNILDVFGRQSQTRLIHTTFWGLCFMASVFSGFFDSIPLGNDLVLKFPTLAAFSDGSDEAFNFDIPKGDTEWESGYSREKKIEKQRKGARSIEKRIAFGGVGAFQGASRCYNGFTFFRGIFILLVRWAAFGCLRILDFMGITRRPRWLTKLGDAGREREITGTPPNRHLIDFWILTDEGELKLPEDFEFDVEKEMRKRELANVSQWGETEESRFDRKLYIWWKIGGSWGERDESGDFEPSRDDREDTTSVVSSMSSNTEPEWEAYESDGCPSTTRNERDTQLNYSLTPSTESEESLLDMGSLARLLDPRDSDARHEAQILASHLMAADKGKVMTRSRFRSKMERDRARVLTSSRYNKFRALGSSSTSIGSNEKRRPTSKEEEEILENLILSLRLGHENSADTYFQEPHHRQPEPESWKTGASGLGADGPQCVICQAAPRSIISIQNSYIHRGICLHPAQVIYDRFGLTAYSV
ncbi:conserved hypothetical protein [Histoplasma mississippiense (nom. inval.)]|uniref:conserved hypothetical protein n=1 Tax=Ajellomyces capsulatus (strain NAm1 / WU24) TaxID=2059318 RepID=UPI000157C797|nr:conserved hypothetical protein [Histoplasma mississippiense (nom. inval.)]EDN08442.1 conserved hypothetical protein [Histoplasma mississippiense (nom. inval.)]